MYIFAEAGAVKARGQFPEFQDVLKDVQDAAFKQAAGMWDGFKPGGLIPSSDQFGIAPFRRNDMAGDTSDSTPSGSYLFTKTFNTVNAWADIFNYTVRNYQIHAFAGLSFADPFLRFSQIRMEIGDRRFPIWDIQYGQNFDRFNLIFKEDVGGELIAKQRERVLIRGYVESTGTQRVVPIGFELFRIPSIMLTET